VKKSSLLSCLIIGLFLTFQSCRRHPEIPITIERLEHSLFSIPIDSVAEFIPRLEQQYGELFDLYTNRIIRIGLSSNPSFPEELTRFLTDSTMNIVYRRVMEVFPDLKDLERDLGRAFYNFRREFPDRVVPRVYTLMSGFNRKMITSDTILAISLDKYLGRDEEMYFLLGTHRYLRQTMDRKYLAVDCMRAWIYTEFPFENVTENVLNNILYEGKVMYAVHRLLPKTPDSILFGFTPEQMRWCQNNKARMWTALVENRLLFSTDFMTISRLIDPAPFTGTFSNESPGRAAVWLGYRIIASYMRRNNVTLEELLLDNDYQQILNRARFRP